MMFKIQGKVGHRTFSHKPLKETKPRSVGWETRIQS